MRIAPFAIAMALLLAAGPVHASTRYVTTGTGTSTQTISDGTPISWTFQSGGSTASVVVGGVFALMAEDNTSFGIRFEVLDVTNTAVLGSTTLSIDDFIAAGGSTVSYARIVFAMPVALSFGDIYAISLSVADNPQTDPDIGGYSIRGTLDPLQFVETESPDTIAVASDNAPVATPAPASMLVMATALLGLAATRRRAGAA